MQYRLHITEQAADNIETASFWYAIQAPEQFPRFLAEYERTVKQVRENPHLAREGEPDLRFVKLRIFPYHLWYTVDGDLITIIRLLHIRQDRSQMKRN